jgi:dTDP-4-dehydrorhamnose reductase
MMQHVLVTGKNGQLGFELCRVLSPVAQVSAVDVEDVDLSNPAAIRTMLLTARPNIIINAAAYTDVEKAEDEPLLADSINGTAVQILAEEAKSIGAGFVHYSTDYIFDGSKKTAYVEEDAPNPLNAYGKSKLAGETAIRAVGGPHLILRTSWLYGARGRNFLLTILRKARQGGDLRIVNDQVGAPTWCRNVAEVTARMLVQFNWFLPSSGQTYHVTARGSTTWYGFANMALAFEADSRTRNARLIPVATRDYPAKARRPANSILNNDKLFKDFGIALPHWKEDLKSVLARLKQTPISL